MGTMFKAAGFVIYLVLALATGRRIDSVQSHLKTVLISDISPGDANSQQYWTEGQKEAMLSSLHNFVRNSAYEVDDNNRFLLYVMCQFDLILWKCERLSSRMGSKQITNQDQQPETDQNVQPETDQNIQPTTDQSTQLRIDHNVQQKTDQNIQPTTDQNKQPKIDHNAHPVTSNNVQPKTDQNIQTTTVQSKQLETNNYVRRERDKDIQPTKEKPMQHESLYEKDSEIDHNLSLSVDEYEMIEENTDDMGPAGSLLCQMCTSVKITAEREKCETRFCDY